MNIHTVERNVCERRMSHTVTTQEISICPPSEVIHSAQTPGVVSDMYFRDIKYIIVVYSYIRNIQYIIVVYSYIRNIQYIIVLHLYITCKQMTHSLNNSVTSHTLTDSLNTIITDSINQIVVFRKIWKTDISGPDRFSYWKNGYV